MHVRNKLKVIIFGTDTRAGRLFDVILLWTILFSILLVMLETVPPLNAKYHKQFKFLEWVITGLFTIEYFLRIWVVRKKSGYIFSFFGIIDLLSVIPSYIGLFISGYHTLIVFRAIRLLRLFRVFQLTEYLSASATMGRAMLASFKKIVIFLSILIVLVMILGTIMFVVEGPENGFGSIPQSIYWAIVTITTVGYGDITPVTVVGKFVSSVIMLLGYSIIAVPTGIVTAEFAKSGFDNRDLKSVKGYCHHCGIEIYDSKASYCRNCGTALRDTDKLDQNKPV